MRVFLAAWLIHINLPYYAVLIAVPPVIHFGRSLASSTASPTMSVVGSVLSTPTTATSVSSTSSSVAASATPGLQFVGLGEMFTCGLSPIHWQYTGPSASLSLNITNINVPQQPPLSSSTSSTNTATSTSSGTTSTPTSAVLRRQYSGYGGSYLPNINEQIGTQLNVTATNNYTWSGVNVPQGWYQLLATVQGVLQTSSSTFFVQNGTNVACVPQFATVSSTTSSVPTTSSQTAVVGASGHSHAGAIAGGVIGGIAFFAAGFVAFLFWFLRRRRSRGGENHQGRRWSAMALKRSSHGRSSTRKDPHHSDLPVLEADQTFIGSDEELSTVGHEKAIAAITPTMLPYHPSHPQDRRTSTMTTGSHTRVMSNPEPPLRPPSYQPHTGEVYPLERAQTAGNGPRRKPAPRYEEAGEIVAERNAAYSSSTTLDSIHGNTSRNSHGGNTNGSSDAHALQHQSSFGAMRPMHVIIPDPPPPART